MADCQNNVIDDEDQEIPDFDWVNSPQARAHSAIVDLKHEMLHRVMAALYEAQRKDMQLYHVLQAIKEMPCETIDDFGLAIHQFDEVMWGCKG